jgi:hypothetical protein
MDLMTVHPVSSVSQIQTMPQAGNASLTGKKLFGT